MRTLDRWLIARTKSMLDFLFDWFGITQKLVERALIVVFGFSYFIKVTSIYLNAPATKLTSHWSFRAESIFGIIAVLILWRAHTWPAAKRMVDEHTAYAVVLRLSLGILNIFTFVTFLLIAFSKYFSLYEFAYELQGWALAIFMYVIATDIDGERKSAKLAWSKIKELFGTAWIPQPKGTES